MICKQTKNKRCKNVNEIDQSIPVHNIIWMDVLKIWRDTEPSWMPITFENLFCPGDLLMEKNAGF